MSSECRRVREMLPLALLGEMESGASRRMEEHLVRCSDCREEADRISRLLGRLAAAEVPDPGPAYWNSFLPRLKGRIAREGIPRALPPAGNRWAVAASVALLALAAATSLSLRPSPERGSRLALERLAARSDPQALHQALEELLPGTDLSRPAGVSAGGDTPGPAELQRAMEFLFPPDEDDISGAVSDLSRQARRLLLRTLRPDRV
jgi:putative zinc finger protein